MVRAASERPAGLLPRLLRDGAEPGWLVRRLDELSSAAAAAAAAAAARMTQQQQEQMSSLFSCKLNAKSSCEF